MGAEFIDETSTWISSDSSLMLRKYNDNVRQSRVLFLRSKGADFVNSAVQALSVENAKKL
jgi:hypothetical protein